MTLGDVIKAFRLEGCPERIIERAAVLLATKERSPNASRQASYRERKRADNLGDTAAVTVTQHVSRTGRNIRDGAVTVTHALRYSNAQTGAPEVAPQEIYNSTPHPTPTNKQTRASARTRIPSDALPSQLNIDFAVKQGIVNGTLQREWAKFVSHHSAKGNLMVDWDAAWRTWCLNAGQFQPRIPSGSGARDSKAARMEAMREENRLAFEREKEELQNGGKETGTGGQERYRGAPTDGLFSESFGQDSGYPERR